MLVRSRKLHPAASSHTVSFLALLHDPTAAERASRLAAIYDPRSRAFGRFETLRDLERAGPLPRAVQRIQTGLRHAGLTAAWHPGDDWLEIRGPAGAIERLFRVRIDAYLAPSGRRFVAAAHDPIVPRAFHSIIAATGHLSSYPDRRATIVPVGGLSPTDLLTAYNMRPLRRRGLNGSGETIAFVEIDGYHQSDFDTFTQRFGLPAMHPHIAAGGALSNVDGEAELDLEVAHEIAPAAKLVVYNCDRNTCSDSDLVNLEGQAVRGTGHGIISISLGGCETGLGRATDSAENSVFAGADALGEAVFVASGDSGAFTCLTNDWGAPPMPRYIGVSVPASDSSVTAVGGTRLSLNPNSSWYREEAWVNPPESAGTGGGISAYFGRPTWQHGPGVVNGFDSSGRREVPDVAADADPLSGAQIVINGSVAEVGGTSQAAPIWAGMTALIDQYLRRRGLHTIGFLNPALYRLASGAPAHPPFHDVTLGTNLVYPATRGYDLATGLGTPDAWNLARDLATYEGSRR